MGKLKICIDTNIYTALKKGDKEITALLETADDVYVPAIVIGELQAGFLMGNQFSQNNRELEDFLKQPGVEVISIDENIALRYGHLIKSLKEIGKPIPVNDVWIAAACLETGTRLASLDKHFDFIPGILRV
jgi:predicted nucleic acid-binding protein